MAGVRQLKELSGRLGTQVGMDRRASSAGRQSDGDDSRQHSPDKEAKHGSSGRSAVFKTGTKSGQLLSSRPMVPQTAAPQHKKPQHLQAAGHPAKQPALRQAPKQSAPGLAPIRQSQVRTLARPAQGQGLPSRRPTITQQPSGTPVASISPAVQLTGHRAAPVQPPQLQSQPSHSSTCQSISTESSCSSGVSPHEQLLLAAAIQQLHSQAPHHRQLQHQQQHQQVLKQDDDQGLIAAGCSNSSSSQQPAVDSSDALSQLSQQPSHTGVLQQHQAQLLPRRPSNPYQQQRPSSAQGLRPALIAGLGSSSRDASATAAVLAALNRGAESVLQPHAPAAATEAQQEPQQLQQEQPDAAQIPSAPYLEAAQQAGDCADASHGSSSSSAACQPLLQQQGVDTYTAPAAASTAGSKQVAGSCSAWNVPSERSSRDVSAAIEQVAGSCSAADLPSEWVSRDVSEMLLSGKGSLTASEFEAVTQDVAARIIQTYWHLYKQRCSQQQEQQQEAQSQQQEQQHQHVQQRLPWQQEQCKPSDLLQPMQQRMANSQLLSHSSQDVPECTNSTGGSCNSRNDTQQSDSTATQQHMQSGPGTPLENVSTLTQQQPGTCTDAVAYPCSDGAAQDAIDTSKAAAAEPSSSCSEQSNRNQALAPQVSAAALGKLRASAGSRNAARLQQCRQVGASAVHHQQPQLGLFAQPGLLAQPVVPVCAGGLDSSEAPQQQCVQQGAWPAAAASSSQGAGPDGIETRYCAQEQQHEEQGQQQQQQQQQQGVAGAAKLSAILAYLDAVEASVETEGVNQQGTQLRPATSCLSSVSNLHTGVSAARPSTAHPISSCNPWHQQQQQQHERQQVLMWDGPVLQQVGSSSMGSGWVDGAVATAQYSSLGTSTSAAFPVISGGSTQQAPSSAPSRPAALAESVFGGVKSKMQNLKAALAAKEDMLQSMTQELQGLRESHQQQLQQQAAAHQQQLATVAAESSAGLSRHMSLIDKLMEEKGTLASRLDDAQKAAVAAEERHAAAVAALKQGWAAELKRQHVNWEAAAAAKQAAWRTAKVAEINEQTVKGLEVEVQRLINRHKADMEAAHDRADEQVKVALEGAKAEHEKQMQALRDRMRQQQDEVIERERAAAASRLCEASERWEAQLQASRMRLAADNDMKLEAAAAVAREEKRKGEAALEAAEARFAAREALMKEEWEREKEALARTHTRAMEAAKQAAADERTAWRAAVTEKLKRQAADREDKQRAELLKQRDEQLEVVIRRLEAEGAAARAAAADKVAAEHAAAMTALQEQLQQSQKGAKRLAERSKAAATAAAAAERQKLELEQQLEQARKELTQQQGALATARAALSAKDSEAASAAAAAAASVVSSVGALQGDKARLEGRLQEAQEQLRQARQQHEVEMQHLESRVKAAVARKDEAIQQLQQQLSAALEALRGTEAVLAAQQEELYD